MNRAELLDVCFGRADFPPSNETFELVHGSDVLCHVAAYEKTVVAGGRSIEVWGIGQVCTDPSWRCLGLATSLLSAAHQAGLARGLQFAVLFSSDESFYGKRGYRREGEVGRSRDLRPRCQEPALLVRPLTSASWPKGPVSTGPIW